MKTTLDIIERAFSEHRGAIAFSGGSDSLVLMNIIFTRTKHRPAVVYANSQMEHPATLPFILETCQRYGAELHVAKADRTPLQQWQKSGWPMLGKLAARLWMQRHRHRNMGFRLDVSSCCRVLKIAPARKLIRSLGLDMQLTGQRGAADDALRGLRAIKDGASVFVKADKLHVVSPLTGWTDSMIRRYIEQNGLHEHPAKAAGAVTIGCMFCGGGAQFTNSGFPILRRQCPDLWRWFIVEAGAGAIILSIRNDMPLHRTMQAIERRGGLAHLADTTPTMFDYLTTKPRKGYDK